MIRASRIAAMALVLVLGVACAPGSSASGPRIPNFNHVVVIYQENWSFDGLFGEFPGANGIASAGSAVVQVDKHGQPYPSLPPALDNRKTPAAPDPRIPSGLPVRPFDLARYVPPSDTAGNPLHRFYQEQYQIDGGRMDGYVAWTDTGGLVMSYYDATNLPVGRLASRYTLLDNFFHGAFGGSSLNHHWLICACVPTWKDAPADQAAQLDPNGKLLKDGVVTPDGYVVNTAYSPAEPRSPKGPYMPLQTAPTIGDRLSEKGVSWAWYAGGWDDAAAGHADPQFAYNHQPFLYFANYAPGTPGRAHLKDERDFVSALADGSLPAVSFVKPIGEENEHPGTADLIDGQQHVADLVDRIERSRYAADTVIVIAYDENGGRWDHVPPPAGDRWGPGTRVPAILAGPLAANHKVDHSQYETTSILRMIERRWQLAPLGSRDASAPDLTNALLGR